MLAREPAAVYVRVTQESEAFCRDSLPVDQLADFTTHWVRNCLRTAAELQGTEEGSQRLVPGFTKVSPRLYSAPPPGAQIFCAPRPLRPCAPAHPVSRRRPVAQTRTASVGAERSQSRPSQVLGGSERFEQEEGSSSFSYR